MGWLLRVFQLRLLWPLLILLAAFVIFFEFVADVGGSAEPMPSPSPGPLPVATPSPSAGLLTEPRQPLTAELYSSVTSSNTRFPLS